MKNQFDNNNSNNNYCSNVDNNDDDKNTKRKEEGRELNERKRLNRVIIKNFMKREECKECCANTQIQIGVAMSAVK